MSKCKYSPWYPGTVDPVRPGVYEREMRHGERDFSRWYAGNWMQGYASIRYAEGSIYETTVGRANFRWRGLAYDPGAK